MDAQDILVWKGSYVDMNEAGEEVPFSFSLYVQWDGNNGFRGWMWDSEFNQHTDLKIDVIGQEAHGKIRFLVNYPCLFDLDENNQVVIDLEQTGHSVQFNGYWMDDQKMWTGEWEITGDIEFKGEDYYEQEYYGGSFELFREKV